jgi:phosphohistidine phosphatase SixA
VRTILSRHFNQAAFRTTWLAMFFALVTIGCETHRVVFIVPVASGLQAEIAGAEVQLTWSRTPAATQVRLLRRLNTPPVGPGDTLSTLVFAGAANTVSDDLTSLLPTTSTAPRTYHYALFACLPSGACDTSASRAEVSPTLVQCLRAGGYTLWWRHASATVCSDRLDLGGARTTTVPNWWKSCDPNCPPAGNATARQLNADAFTEATSIGQAFDALGIPVGRVISSEYCRCFRTAELMDFGPTVERDTSITYYVYDEGNRCAHSLARIGEVPSHGTNTAIIGHAGFTGMCPTLIELAWGEAAIYKPKGNGSAELIARLLWNEWGALSASNRVAVHRR